MQKLLQIICFASLAMLNLAHANPGTCKCKNLKSELFIVEILKKELCAYHCRKYGGMDEELWEKSLKEHDAS